jgi:hypothetical protein
MTDIATARDATTVSDRLSLLARSDQRCLTPSLFSDWG